MNNIENNICEAVELIVEKSINEAGYDKTIQATIQNCEDESIGKYKVRYQDSLFYAYSSSVDITYSNNTMVYVLVPGNDMNKDKTILGTVEKLGINYIGQVNEDEAYNINGTNCITSSNTYLLSSYEQIKKPIYPSDDLKINIKGLEEYIKESSSLICGATFKTNLNYNQQSQGNYGIIFNLTFVDNAKKEDITRSYVVDVDNMTGNPYKLNSGKRQYEIYNIDGANFKEINSIYIFAKNFPHQLEKAEIESKNLYDIEISNIELSGATRMPDEELNGYGISFHTPDGTFFAESEDENTASKRITAKVRIKGKTVNSKLQKIPFYWFREDISVTSKSPYYNKYGGRGWRCLNNYNVIEEDPRQVEWIPTEETLTFRMKDATAAVNKLKCVTLHDGIVYSKEITIKNFQHIHKITISSDLGTKFYYDIGKPTLTCLVDGNSEQTNEYVYYWAQEDANENLIEIDNKTNQLEKIEVGQINDFVVYKCSVYKNGNYIGTAEITLTNKYETEGLYTLIINNGNQNFQYDESGISPASPAQDNPIQIPVLSYTLLDNLGREIDPTIVKQSEVLWKVPIKNTMLMDIETDGEKYKIDPSGEYIYYKNASEVVYHIQNKYFYDYQNNNIELNINYKGMTLVATTNLVFTKQGEPGTNGTNYTCKIFPNTDDRSFNEYPTLTLVDGNAVGHFNFKYKRGDSQNVEIFNNRYSYHAPFTVKLYESGEEIFSGSESGVIKNDNAIVTIEWEMLCNSYKAGKKDDSDLTIDKNNGTIKYIGKKDKASNIIKCTVYYQDKNSKDRYTLYDTLPVILTTVHNQEDSIYLKKNTGFRYVEYASDGTKPKYDSAKPFELISNSKITKYVWTNIGSYYNYGSGLFEDHSDLINLTSDIYTNKLEINQHGFKPVSTYNGVCVNNAVKCTCFDNETEIGTIYIPIHFFLNKYGLAHLNGWDGNSIQVNEDGGFILSPQMGAGKKEEDNSFTGILMGEVQEPNRINSDVGVLGYNKGTRSFKLDAKDGSAAFGSGQAQILIDPSSGMGVLYSKDYYKNYTEDGKPSSYGNGNLNGKGLLINLSTPEIRYGNKNFSVDENGYLVAKGGGSIAGWNIDDDSLFTSTKSDSLNVRFSSIDFNRSINGKSYNNLRLALGQKFAVSADGTLYAGDATIGTGVNKITIGKSDASNSAIYSGNKNSLDSSYNGFYLGTNGFSLGSNFKVTSSGELTAKSGYIGNGSSGWTIGSNYLKNNKDSYSDSKTGVYIGTDGLGLGNDFYVTKSGVLYSKSGTIGNWRISDSSLSNDGNGNSTSFGNTTGIYFGSSGLRLGSHFSVNSNGDLKATSGTFGGFTIESGYLHTGGGTWAHCDPGEIYIGPQGINLSEKFYVDANGNLYAENGTFNGSVRANKISYGGSSGYFSGSGLAGGSVSTFQTSGGINTSLGYANYSHDVFSGNEEAEWIQCTTIAIKGKRYAPGVINYRDWDGNARSVKALLTQD